MLRSIRSTRRLLPLLLLVLAFSVLAMPATAEVFHLTLKNGTTVDSSVQPQQASWDPNMIMLLTEVGNWVAFPKDDIAEIKTVDPTAGFGVRISSTAIALGRFSNDLPDTTKGGANGTQEENKYLSLATRALEAADKQQHYSVQQFVSTEQTQGIPSSFGGGGYGGFPTGGGLGGGVPTQSTPGGSPPPVPQPPGGK